jgi:hypothetical protein
VWFILYKVVFILLTTTVQGEKTVFCQKKQKKLQGQEKGLTLHALSKPEAAWL